ncbi:MAG: hypothetical protein HZB25_05550 [Candidatus Eisenbacteria bacterium]|nr:hypothetical protein [Candidatus Eisenbacteria bacterium]
MTRLLRISSTIGCVLAALGSVSCAEKVVNPPASPQFPDSVLVGYVHDAHVLAWRDLTSGGQVATDQIEIPQATADEYYQALKRVYLACPGKAPFADIHISVGNDLRMIVVGVRKTAHWADSLIAGASTTGNARFDSLRREYRFSLVDVSPFTETSRVLVLQLPRDMNTLALIPMFIPIEGVVFAEPNSRPYPGLDIIATPGTGHRLRLQYVQVCTLWQFTLSPGDTVTFDGHWGIPCKGVRQRAEHQRGGM